MELPEPRPASSHDDADLLGLLFGLTGDPPTAEERMALWPDLNDARDLADTLLTLELEEVAPETGFDPSWPEEQP